MADSAVDILKSWLTRQLSADQSAWLDDQITKLQRDGSERTLRIALGMIPRRLGKNDLEISSLDVADAQKARPGLDPRGWSIDMTARILVLCIAADQDNDFSRRFSDLCRTADVAESIAYYCGLPLYPAPELLESQAAEGVRSNMRAVFEAVVHNNPYPREQFDQSRWNQMVLKALFVGSSLKPIQGLEERANPELAAILCDYAHERWAAGRPVAAELWRCVGPFATGTAVNDLRRALEDDDLAVRRAAALALSRCPDSEARDTLEAEGALAAAIADGSLTWDTIGN